MPESTCDVSRKVARVAVTEAVSRLSHLEDLLIWYKPFTAFQWDACEKLLMEALREIHKGRSAYNLVTAQREAQAQRDETAMVMQLDRMGMSEVSEHLGVHPAIAPAIRVVHP